MDKIIRMFLKKIRMIPIIMRIFDVNMRTAVSIHILKDT